MSLARNSPTPYSDTDATQPRRRVSRITVAEPPPDAERPLSGLSWLYPYRGLTPPIEGVRCKPAGQQAAWDPLTEPHEELRAEPHAEP